jgi:hypothetical protein
LMLGLVYEVLAVAQGRISQALQSLPCRLTASACARVVASDRILSAGG